MLRLGIISNPFAKLNKNHPEHNTQMWYTLANEGLYKVTYSLRELEKVCEEYCARKINFIGIVGGDGSVGLVLSHIFKAYKKEPCLPKILLLKGGTINFLASNLGIHTSALSCLNDTLFFIKKNLSLYETPLRTIEVNDRMGFIFAGGIATGFLEEFYKKKSNSLGAALTLGKCLADGLLGGKLNGIFKKIVQQKEFTISTTPSPLWSHKDLPNNEELYTLVFASTVPKLPLNLNLFRKLSFQSKSAEILVITETGLALMKGVLSLFAGNDITMNPGVDSVLFENAVIQAQSRLAYSLDGDLCYAEDGKIDMKLGPVFVFCSPYPIGV